MSDWACFWAFHARAYEHDIFSKWRKRVAQGDEVCYDCQKMFPKKRICPECGRPLAPKDPGSYFPGWGKELPCLVRGEMVMSSNLFTSLTSSWTSFPPDSTGVFTFRPSEMVAMNYDGRLDRSDMEFYSDVFRSMTTGYRSGRIQADEYKERVKPKKGR